MCRDFYNSSICWKRSRQFICEWNVITLRFHYGKMYDLSSYLVVCCNVKKISPIKFIETAFDKKKLFDNESIFMRNEIAVRLTGTHEFHGSQKIIEEIKLPKNCWIN